MASYDLKCSSCGNDFEVFVQGFLREDMKVCPDCGSVDVEQLFTGFLCGSGSGSSSEPAAGGCSAAGAFG